MPYRACRAQHYEIRQKVSDGSRNAPDSGSINRSISPQQSRQIIAAGRRRAMPASGAASAASASAVQAASVPSAMLVASSSRHLRLIRLASHAVTASRHMPRCRAEDIAAIHKYDRLLYIDFLFIQHFREMPFQVYFYYYIRFSIRACTSYNEPPSSSKVMTIPI